MNNSQGKDKIYDQLKGYFPAEYDLTPEELEKEIELENKKREIALGMMRTRLTPEREICETENETSDAEVIETADDRKIKNDPSPTPEMSTLIMPAVGAHTETEKINDAATAVFSAVKMTEVKDIPEAEDVTENELLCHYEPLDNLFTELEDDTVSSTPLLNEDTKLRKTADWLFDFLEVFSICIACIIVVFALMFRLTRVSGESMEDTLFDKEYLVVSDMFYEPKAGDIVVIQNTSLTHELLKEPLVKRVIAVGGETVEVFSNGMVSVTKSDGSTEVLDQHFTKKEPYSGISGKYEVPEGYVFVMGDNRNHSTDSRSPLVGLVDERCIFGKALVRILPFDAFTVFENPYTDK